MNELICPICGRANLLSAINCRYCQAPLETSSQTDSITANENHLFEINNQPEEKHNISFQPIPDPIEVSPNNKEEPEWLKRIRELKRADEQKEKERDQWRQQTLFSQNEKHKLKQNLSNEKKKPVNKVTAEPPEHSSKQIKSTATSLPEHETETPIVSTNMENQGDENLLNEIKQELPDGFIPLDDAKKQPLS